MPDELLEKNWTVGYRGHTMCTNLKSTSITNYSELASEVEKVLGHRDFKLRMRSDEGELMIFLSTEMNAFMDEVMLSVKKVYAGLAVSTVSGWSLMCSGVFGSATIEAEDGVVFKKTNFMLFTWLEWQSPDSFPYSKGVFVRPLNIVDGGHYGNLDFE